MDGFMLSRSITDDGMTRFSDLPSDLVINILLRLPLKILMTCKFVCKDWTRLFRDPSFIKLQLAASPIHIMDLYLGQDRIFQFCQVMEDKRTGNLEVQKFRTKLNLRDATYNYICINSCNGLLCLMHEYDFLNESLPFRRSVCVCNPILGEWVSITLPVEAGSSTLALVFSAKNNQYKVLHGSIIGGDYRFQIYTLGGSRRWRSIDGTLGCRLWHGNGSCMDFNTFVHGSLHWIGYAGASYMKEPFICCFDADNERFRRFSLPYVKTDNYYGGSKCEQLGVINGCLSARFRSYGISNVEIWAMKEYGVEKSWSMMLAIGTGFTRDFGLAPPHLLYSLNEDEILVIDGAKRLLCYNMKRERLRHCRSYNLTRVIAYNPSFVSLHDVAKGEQVMQSR